MRNICTLSDGVLRDFRQLKSLSSIGVRPFAAYVTVESEEIRTRLAQSLVKIGDQLLSMGQRFVAEFLSRQHSGNLLDDLVAF